MTFFNVVNTGDIKVLKDRVKILNETIGLTKKNIRITEEQRNENRMHEIAWINTARTLSKKLGLDFEIVKEQIFKTALNKTKKDFEKRGMQAYKKAIQFTVRESPTLD
ncbi:MAG: hypothetical protein GY718_05670 [Lentisphaerae bacterium]|nr:hypothetical protein [Lentisphaerota bacterium]